VAEQPVGGAFTHDQSNSRTVTGMRRTLMPVLSARSAVALAVTVALVGCGGGGVKPKAWTGQVCQALTPWRGQISTLNSRAAAQMTSATTPSQTRTNLLALLDGARTASDQARVRVAAAGIPDVADGKSIASHFVAALAQVRDAYAAAQHTISGLAITDPAAFYDGVSAAIDQLNKKYAQAGLDTGTLASAELRKDFDEVPACTSG
jgi:hypothetical protein